MKHHQHRASVLLESLNPGDRFRFCFESNNFIYEKGEQVGKFIEVKQVIPAAGTPEVFYRNTLVIKFIKRTRQTGQRKKAINSGKRVCVTYPNAAAKYGVTTSDANKYSRIGVCFDDGTWGYVHVDFVTCA